MYLTNHVFCLMISELMLSKFEYITELQLALYQRYMYVCTYIVIRISNVYAGQSMCVS